VVIDLGNSEFIFLAHFKLGSFMVKAGDQVRAGQKIGKCGNSGNSPVPHLHVHMQNSPQLFDGEGLPMQFHNYLAQKKFVSAGELENGQTVRDKKPK
jgi:murein DD-endopeptidase MepM/ murein hydrolase activator NlpD